jgi:hypothetical protein
MNARRSLRAPLRLTALLVAGAAAACVTSPKQEIRPDVGSDENKFIATDSSWLNGVLEKRPADKAATGVHAVSGNRALQPDDPWLGAVGWQTPIAAHTEVGVGVCVPGSDSTRRPTAAAVDRTRTAGAGVWLKLDF